MEASRTSGSSAGRSSLTDPENKSGYEQAFKLRPQHKK
jgi:hypothetical protein